MQVDAYVKTKLALSLMLGLLNSPPHLFLVYLLLRKTFIAH